MNTNKWIMPSYYKDFKCKCDKCRHTCCSLWKIPVSQDEYFKLIGMDCSKELQDKLDIAFEDPKTKDEKTYKYISFNWLGNCPMQKDGLCLLHKEKGEDKLPRICRLFPRSLKKINNQLIASCSSSCEAVVEMLIQQDSLQVTEDYLNEEPQIVKTLDEDVINELNEFTIILKDRSTTLVQSIKAICLIINKEEFINDYNLDINPVNETLNLLNRFSNSDNFLSDINKEIRDRYIDNLYQYEIDKEIFEKKYPKWMYYFENIINNSLMYECFPFVDDRFDKTKAYKGLCACYGLLRLVTIGYTSIHNDDEALVDSISELFHLIDHTAFYYNVNVICNSAALLLKL